MRPGRQTLAGMALLGLLAAGGLLAGDLIDPHWIDAWIRGRGFSGELLFVAAATLLMSIGLSRQVVAFLAGYGYGFGFGVVLAMCAVVAACITTFYLARHLLRGSLARHSGGRLRDLAAFVRDNTFGMTLLFRLLPLGSNWLVNLAAGASGVHSVPFFTASALGYLPQMLIFALAGSGSRLHESWRITIAGASLLVAAMLGAWLVRRYLRLPRIPAGVR